MSRSNWISLWLMFVISVGILASPAVAVDHKPWDDLLSRHVQGGFFDYEAFMNSRTDRQQLRSYLKDLSEVKPSELNPDERLAFWINLYNAGTIRLIEKHYPVSSIKDIGGWFTTPWEIDFLEADGRSLTLDQVEHEIIRVEFEEPRIHFALVCAASSCPPLRDEAYVGDRIDTQLASQTRQFVGSDMNRFIVRDGSLRMRVSSIFSWYGEDFGGESGLAKFLQARLPARKASLIEQGNYSIRYRDYDWTLNQTPGPYE